MATLLEVEEQALRLPEDQRARLAAHLLESLPAMLHDEDAGVSEAMRRDAELEQDPSSGMTLEEFKASFGR
jgi:putative addiction module component (TIGR02574 family)